MVVLVTGANGQLGSHIRLLASNSPHTFIFTDIDTLDITNAEAVQRTVASHNVECIINCAAYTNVDRAEDDEPAAHLINATAPRILAEAIKARGGWLIHVSTDYVFGGTISNTPCNELQPVNPTGAYGRTKLAGEQAVVGSGCNYLIIRTAWLYSEYGKNFVKTMLALTSQKDSLNVVYDQVGTPTYAADLAKAIFHIIDNQLYHNQQGIYNYSDEGVCSWFDFAMAIARIAGNTNCAIYPCRSSEFPSKVVRPSYSVLDKSKIKHTFGLDIPYWLDSLGKCLANINNKQ